MSTSSAIRQVFRLGFPWQTLDPFLFCVHHDDAYPVGNDLMGPAASLAGRHMGMDFEGKDGWRMYHGDRVPGFPQHPHRGFETVTLARRGFIDHSDSLGATARFGRGDAQWMTAGKGVVHSEMFPLLSKTEPNPVELFQIWLNLPAADKLVAPHFAMLWGDKIPVHVARDAAGRETRVTVVAGRLDGVAAPPAPPPHSWAAKPEHDVAIMTIVMAPGVTWTLPAGRKGSNRVLYFFRGQDLRVAGQTIPRAGTGIAVVGDQAIELVAGPEETELLLLGGQPIGEPVAQHGPFVMNSPGEIRQAFADYQRTQFGGWPWPVDEPVHPRDAGRFAKHADGRIEKP